jgi:outer membrane receptor for ferrienterochelin and colicins
MSLFLRYTHLKTNKGIFVRYFFLWLILIFISLDAKVQNTFNGVIRNAEGEPLPGATIVWKEAKFTTIADSIGKFSISNIPNGKQSFVFSFVEYAEQSLSFIFPLPADSVVIITLSPEEHEDEEVIVTATRTSGTIANAPTRVEVLTGEEMDEKGNMVPGDIRMVLNESTGIQTQQTSATSYNSSIRIQGLDGRYTQILRDGYPLYSGFAGGLSIMQIAPLDLRQVELIKGSSSTLYGGGAIAGLVNLVSKTPTEKRQLDFMGNATTAGGLDLSGFYAERYNETGVTVFLSRNSGSPFDPADIGLTAIPKFERYTVNPRVFFYGQKTTIDIGGSFITEDRVGGSMNYIKNDEAGYFEKNNSDRITAQAGIVHRVSDNTTFNFKTSFSRFKRSIEIPSYLFSGKQNATFSELTFNSKKDRIQWVAGLNLITDDFEETKQSIDAARDFHTNTSGVFLQNTWSPDNFLTLETGLRSDYVKDYGLQFLPRISALFKFSTKLTSRIGGGLGYKTPTVFNEEAERIQFQNILPIDKNKTNVERSAGGNFDINYRSQIGRLRLHINQLFFYTRLNRTLDLFSTSSGKLEFLNTNGYVDSKGLETNIGLVMEAVKFYFGYTYTDVNTHFNGNKEWFPLTPRHRLNYTLVYEKEGFLKAGLEAYYNSPQKLSDGAKGKDYWMFGFMTEKIWKKFSVFVNFENFTDARQTKFDTIFTGNINTPVFRDIYASVEGFVANGGIRIRL